MADRRSQDPARIATANAIRNAYGRILALLTARNRDIAASEDALSEAMAKALEVWPETGVPDRPEAWLVTTARRALIDRARRETLASDRRADVQLMLEESEAELSVSDDIPDERLRLLFACTHPDIEPGMQAPLMLQTVMGLDAGRVASAFLLRPATMGQRLVRQKTRLKDSATRFEIPERDQWPSRLDAVLQAIYGAYNAGWEDHADTSLAHEALFLARLVCQLAPYEAEAAGLIALILHSEARRQARRGPEGQFIPLDAQDTDQWDTDLIKEAEMYLGKALRLGRPGRFQLEAALQSAHNARQLIGRTDWSAILLIYDRLIALSPTFGAFIGRAAALGEVNSPQAGLAALDELPEERMKTHQPYWATRAHLLAKAGQHAQARMAYETAAGLTSDAAVRTFLLGRRTAL